ncbi:uncharacterized protein CG7065-like isoform X2 [Rhodnius prolixus]|uniref:uncharacterized protein CG7065-like isoform X2 n=1 Tax=Rhodnius prolixus TaxID=13249 RepID=UPI003D18C45C
MEHQNQTSEVKRALQEKVLLDDGRLGYVFSELVPIGPSNRWHCHVCSRTLDSERALVMHLSHPYHTTKLRICEHPARNFPKFADRSSEAGSTKKDRSPIIKTEGGQSSWEMTTDVLPGEPVPPGMEDVVEGVCQIQSTFDEHPGPLIGLEYIVELVTSEEESEPRYICLLCEKKGDPRSLMVHVTSQNHCLKYISCFFRTAGNALNMIPRTAENRKGVGIAIMKVAQEIERNYGRLKPTSAVAETFSLKKYEILRQIDEKEHFRETSNTTFASYVTPEKIREYSEENDVETTPFSAQSNKIKSAPIPMPKPYDPYDKDKGHNSSTVPRGIKNDKPPGKGVGEDDPIEVTSSISSVSSSIESDDDDRRENHSRRSSSRDRYSAKKRRLSPDDERRKYLYRNAGRRGISPSRRAKGSLRSRSRSRTRSRSRSRSRSRDRRCDYYRERDRLKRSPSYGRFRSGRLRYDDRHSEERYRRRSQDRDRYERDRRRRGESRERLLERRDRRSVEKKKDSDSKWDRYRAELSKLELSFESKLKYFEEKPEKHPKYSEEWKGFWNKRYKEIQLSGKDPTTYDFKPEWIIYWAKRMKELSEEDFNKEREVLKKKLNVDEKPEKPPSSDLQDVSPPTPESQKDVTVDDIKNTWKALTGSEITAPNNLDKSQLKRSPSPWENNSLASTPSVSQPPDSERSSISTRKPYDIAPPVLHCLRMLSVLEHQLGSLGPKVMELLSKALILERTKYNSSMTLLKDVDIHIFFETVKEKIRGQLIAGIVMRNLVSSSRAIIKAIESMLETNPPEPNKLSPLVPATIKMIPPPKLQTSEPVQVPGIGMIDKMAVAQQIASALVAQGRTDVTQEELEDLINAVVGIAKASNANVSKNISSAAFFSQLNIENSTATSHINEILSNMISSAQKSLGKESKPQSNTISDAPHSVQQPVTQEKQSPLTPVMGPLQVAESVGISKHNIPTTSNTDIVGNPTVNVKSVTPAVANDVSDEELKEKLIKFSILPRDEQQNLIALLKQLESTQATRVENLRKYVSIGLVHRGTDRINQNNDDNKDGRLSPFSSRVGGANPTPDDSQKDKQKLTSPRNEYEDDDDDEDDDDYSVEDVYKAASEKLFKKNENTKLNSESEITNTGNPEYDSNSSNKPFGLQNVDPLSRTVSDNSADKIVQKLPSISAKTGLLPNQGRSVHSNLPPLIDNIFERNEPYQINLEGQNQPGNSFMGNLYTNFQGVRQDSFQRNPDPFSGGSNYFNKNQDYPNSSYNTRDPGSICPSQEPSRNYTNQNWQFGTLQYNTGPPSNDQFNENAHGFFRSGQNEPHFGGYRKNF